MSILSLLVAGFSLIYARRSANASREQTRQQKQAAKDAAQPMLWVDIRRDDGQGQAQVLLLGNSGPSIARNVKVGFDPAPPSTLDIKTDPRDLEGRHRLVSAGSHDAMGFGCGAHYKRVGRTQGLRRGGDRLGVGVRAVWRLRGVRRGGLRERVWSSVDMPHFRTVVRKCHVFAQVEFIGERRVRP